MLLKFDTRNKKPKVWNIAVLSAITIILMAILLSQDRIYLPAVSILACLYLSLTIFFLVSAFIKQIQYNPYSYNTIYYIGFAMFLLSSLISEIVLTIYIGQEQITDIAGLLTLFSVLLGSAKSYMLFSFPFIALYSVGLCLSNIALIRHEGKRLVNLLGILLSFILIGGELFLFFSNYYVSGSLQEVMMHDLMTNLFAALYLYFECMLIGTIIANLIVIRYRPEKDKDYLIILGCGIRKDGTPTPLLAGRIDRALKFYEEQIQASGKAPIFVTSGGQGPNEVISESASMQAYLLEKGVPSEHILEENRSSSTYENMLFCKEMIQPIWPEKKVAFSTTNYHVFRSGLMARRVKMRAVGIGAKTRWYFWPNATVREFIGILTEHRLKQALILGGMVFLYSISTILYYMF